MSVLFCHQYCHPHYFTNLQIFLASVLLTRWTLLFNHTSHAVEKNNPFHITKQIPRLLWNLRIYYGIHKKNPPLARQPSDSSLDSEGSNVYNIMFFSVPRSTRCLSVRLPIEIMYELPSFLKRATCTSHQFLHNLITLMHLIHVFRDKYKPRTARYITFSNSLPYATLS